jgi:CDP-diacylglycerol--serine O-phosphatidyltransferase
MNPISRGLPSFFTSLALLSGCISVIMSAVYGNLTAAGYFVILSAILDFMDGMVARLLKSMSEFGKQLDSLADMVSFGVAPAMILYRLLMASFTGDVMSQGNDLPAMKMILLYSPFIMTAFSALRLAKFNLDEKQVKNFRGLPTPANAMFFIALGFASVSDVPALQSLALNPALLIVSIPVSAFLLVCNLPMFSLKMSSFSVKENSLRYALIIVSAALVVLFRLPALGAIILLYILFSLVNNWLVKMS